MKVISENLCFDGVQRVYEHLSTACQCTMRFGVFIPPRAKTEVIPTLIFLSGLTCNEENFITKSGFQRIAAELGVMVIAPDTSPRGDYVPDTDDEYDFGKGAGFYLDATQEPWSQHYQMETYIAKELVEILVTEFSADPQRLGIFGHSMGGHGALTLHLKNPDVFKTTSAFSPIVAPMQVPWGQKAFSRYLGNDQSTWLAYDTTQLIRDAPSTAEILVDQGGGDQFLTEQLRPTLLEEACKEAGQAISLRLHTGYDHSYFFISTFMEYHLRWHLSRFN